MLGAAVKAAARGDHFAMVLFLLSGERRISEVDLGVTVKAAARSGHLEVARFLLSKRRISKGALGAAVEAAAEGGHIEIVRFLLSKRRRISEDHLGVAVKAAARSGHLEVARFLLSKRRRISKYHLGAAVKAAAEGGHIEIVRFLLSKRRRISEDHLGTAVTAAAMNGHVEVLRILLSEGREISEDPLGIAVEAAAVNGHVEVVRFLLSEGRTISMRKRGECVLLAASQGRAGIVEALLANGPIYCNARDSAHTRARDLASSENCNRILDLLNSAQVEGAAFVPGDLPSDSLHLTFADVKEQPGQYLSQLVQGSFPHRIYLLDAPQVIDLGGVTKQFISIFVTACLEKKIFKLSDGMPQAKTIEEQEHLQALGKVFSHLEKRNANRSDKFVVGELFSPLFYALVQEVATQTDKKELLKKTAQIVKDASSALQMPADILLNPKNEELQQSYAELVADNPLQSAKDYISPFLQAAQSFYSGLDANLQKHFKRTKSEELCTRFQGNPCTAQALIDALYSHPSDQYFGQKFQWLQEKIRHSTLEWRRQFVFSITGNRTLTPGLKIEIKTGWRPGGVFEIHTCFNSLDLPPGDLDKNIFLEALDQVIYFEGYNTA